MSVDNKLDNANIDISIWWYINYISIYDT